MKTTDNNNTNNNNNDDDMDYSGYDLSQKELNGINELNHQINKISVYKQLVNEYTKLLDSKIERLNTNIDEEFERIIESVKEQQIKLKKSLKKFHENKKIKCDNEVKSLTQYSELLTDKNESIKGFIKGSNDMDKSEREMMLLSMIKSTNESKQINAFKNIYLNEFNSIAHFQKILTRYIKIYIQKYIYFRFSI